MKRAIIIVLDSVGIGALPDAEEIGDASSHTLGNLNEAVNGIDIKNLLELGLGNIENSRLPSVEFPRANFGRAMEKTKAKDTTSGHWEMMGVIQNPPFKTYPNGFPKELIDEFVKKTGREILGNTVASGTEIIKELGDEHVRTGKPIVYTSADSVFQIAAHEEVIPLDELYAMCETAREMLHGENTVGRVIARPFLGESGSYFRTENRKDYALPPTAPTVLDSLTDKGYKTLGIGKIEDIFCKQGLTYIDHTRNNVSGIEATIKAIKEMQNVSLIFTNLVDFDMIYGHRNDPDGYAMALEHFDMCLPEIIKSLDEKDLLIITADHGCDPTTESTDHSREYIPVLAYSKAFRKGINIGTLDSFADIGSTVHEYIVGLPFLTGKSFLCRII